MSKINVHTYKDGTAVHGPIPISEIPNYVKILDTSFGDNVTVKFDNRGQAFVWLCRGEDVCALEEKPRLKRGRVEVEQDLGGGDEEHEEEEKDGEDKITLGPDGEEGIDLDSGEDSVAEEYDSDADSDYKPGDKVWGHDEVESSPSDDEPDAEFTEEEAEPLTSWATPLPATHDEVAPAAPKDNEN
jgi:hypothetical protein